MKNFIFYILLSGALIYNIYASDNSAVKAIYLSALVLHMWLYEIADNTKKK